MYSTEAEIHDQAYQFFKQEAPEFLQIIEAGLLSLREDRSTANIHAIMRAAHSIKGGSASLSLEGIKTIAHQLEDVFRSLYRFEGEIDADVEGLLLQAYDCLRVPLMEQLQSGHYESESAIAAAEPIFEVLKLYLGDLDEDAELPTAAELGVDIVQIVFEGDVQQGIVRLQNVLENPEGVPVTGEIRAQVEVFNGIGELLNLVGFQAIAHTTLQALEHNPNNPILVGKVAVANFVTARAEVLAGDRAQGGKPSAELLALTQATQTLEERTIDDFADTSLNTALGAELSREPDTSLLDTSDDWLQSLEQEIDSLSVPSLNLSDPNLPDSTSNAFELAPESNFDIFSTNIDDETEREEANVFNRLDSPDSLDSVFDLVKFDDESILTEISESLAQPDPIQTEIAIKPIAKIAVQNQDNIPPYISETIRVDLSRLERLNNFSSELVTQENASSLQNQQLQAKIERIQNQFKDFEKLSKNLQTWLDKAQRSQVRTQDDSLSLASGLTSIPTATNLLVDFDPLQMDSYNRLHSVIQEALEEIAQMDEGMRDMTVLVQQKQQTQRRKQQILKQLRYDLLWSRMLPLGDILSSLPRMVREMSNKYNKQVNLKLFGTGTLVDKSVLEKLYDPFVHLVRNAFDHGTESTQERLDRGKPLIASIEIRAYYRGNQTYIEIKDDGHGINHEKIKAKAIAVGLLNPEQANQVSNEDIYQFLFEPNFSTAEVVSELSGRGMGLSTVQEQVRSLKGTIEVKSEIGVGTTFTIKLPLTLSIAKLLIFSIQERLMAIAIDTLLGIVTVESNEIQIIQGKEFIRFEERLIPLYPTSIFADGYPLPKKSLEVFSTESFIEENQTTLLLLSDGNQIFALQIDRVINEQELAIKPFGKAIAPPPYIYGCTVLGDGTLVPVIDASAILSLKPSHKSSVSLPSSDDITANSSSLEIKAKPRQRSTVLIIDDSLTTRQSLYLTLGKFGYQVIQAGDGREAIEQLARSPEIQVVICDVEMPNMNGFEFLTICQKESRYAGIPIVMLSSRSSAKHRSIAQMLGASGYLTKPYLEQELIKTIQSLIL